MFYLSKTMSVPLVNCYLKKKRLTKTSEESQSDKVTYGKTTFAILPKVWTSFFSQPPPSLALSVALSLQFHDAREQYELSHEKSTDPVNQNEYNCRKKTQVYYKFNKSTGKNTQNSQRKEKWGTINGCEKGGNPFQNSADSSNAGYFGEKVSFVFGANESAMRTKRIVVFNLRCKWRESASKYTIFRPFSYTPPFSLELSILPIVAIRWFIQRETSWNWWSELLRIMLEWKLKYEWTLKPSLVFQHRSLLIFAINWTKSWCWQIIG